jgi:hypothetical protein
VRLLEGIFDGERVEANLQSRWNPLLGAAVDFGLSRGLHRPGAHANSEPFEKSFELKPLNFARSMRLSTVKAT